MALPFRMNLTTIQIQRLSLSTTQLDDEFKNNAQPKVYGSVETFTGQFYIKTEERRNRQHLGDVPFTDGHITYRTPSSANSELKKGDKIVGIPNGRGGYDTVDYVISEHARAAELPTPLLRMAYFKRNEDVTNSP